MADLYLDQTGQTVQGDVNPIQPITGDKKVDDYLFSLPAEQREIVLKEINAPLTGEEIAAKIKASKWRPNEQEFYVYNDYKNKEQRGFFDDMPNFKEAASGVYEIAGNAVAKLVGHPIDSAAQLVPSVIEAGVQNMNGYVNMVTQSQNPSNPLFKWKNALIGDSNYDAYKQFLEALDVRDHSEDLMSGKATIIMNKDVIDNDLVQASAFMVDPPFIAAEVLTGGIGGLPMKAAQLIGAGERFARGVEVASKIKAGVYGGTLKYGVGVPLEFIGKTTRGTIDKVIEKGSVLAEQFTGVEARDIKTAARVGGFGSIVSGASWASPTSKVYLASGFMGAAGEAIKATGDQMIKNGGKRGLLSFAADAIETSDAMLLKGGSGLTPQARKLLGVLDKADPMLSYAGNFMEGGAIGAAVGGGIGALADGKEGFWAGAGSGFAAGSLGGLVGRASKNFGSALEHERLAAQMDMLMPMKAETDPATHKAYQLIRKQAEVLGIPAHEVDRMLVALDKVAPESKFRAGGAAENEAVIKSFGQDPKTYDGFERDASGAYKLDKDGNKIRLRDSEGFTVPTMEQYNAAGWTVQNDINKNIKVHINTDKLSDLKTSVLHEPWHAIFKELKMRPEFQERLAETILGRYDAQGKQIKPPSIPMSEAEGFFSQYVKNAYTGAERDAMLASIKPALEEYYKTGKMTMLEADGVTPVLARLTEEFGAYYWTAFIQDKPVDYLFKGGQFGTARTLFDGVKNKWQDYMERKVGAVNGGFDFAQRTALNPAFRDAKGKRIRVSALDYMIDDLVRTKVASSKGKSFDFNALSPDGQEAYVRSSGNGIMFEPPKVKGGKYKVRTPAQQKAVRAKNAGAMYTGLDAFRSSNPEALVIKDANGMPVGGLVYDDATKTYTGHPPDAIVDYFIKSGHIDAVEGARIKLLRDAAMGLTDSNVFEFNQYTGDTMNIGIGQNVRVKSPLVATKDRLVILTKFEAVVGKGDYGFYAHTLDYRHLLVRQDAMWKEPKVRAAWGDDKDAFTADLFRYFKNASQPDGVRIPSAGLWTENGEYKRNVLHQVAGLETPATGTINKSLGDIKGDMFSTYRKFRTDRMTGERMSGEKIDFNGDNATDYIRYNMMPSEMAGETTPNGKIFTHPNGYKFFQVEAGFKAHKPDGTVIGTFKTIEEATAKADVIYQKENPAGKPIPSVDNIRQEPLDAPETQAQYTKRKIKDFRQMTDNELKTWIDELEYFNNKGAYELSETIIPKIVQDFKALKADNPDPNFTLQKHIANELENYLFEKQKAFETGKTSPSYGYEWADNIQHGIEIETFFNYEYNKENENPYTGKNPTFFSGLSLALDKILPANLDKNGTVQASRLIKQMSNAAGGDLGKFINEANAIGFTDWLKSKGQTRVSEAEIRQYIEEKGIQVYIDPRTDMQGNEWQGGGFDTSEFVAQGKTEGYHTFVVRINPEYAHGVEGHYGKDAVVHIRATDRVDAQGRKVLFVEEIQSINTAREVLSETQKKEVTKQVSELKKLQEEINLLNAKWENENKKLHIDFKKSKLEAYDDVFWKRIRQRDKILTNGIKELKKGIIGTDAEKALGNQPLSEGSVSLKISELESRLAKVKSNKPLQDMPETVKIASRAIMRKAVELGADRVVLVRPEDMHPDISVNAEGERFVDAAYGKDIPMMIDAELKKYGKKLEPARNYEEFINQYKEDFKNPNLHKKNKRYPEEKTKQILSESLGYDITPEMKQKAGRSQTFMMPAEGEQGAKYTDSEFKHMFIGKVAEDNPDITKGISIIVSKNKTEGGSKTGDNKIKLSLIKAPSGQEIGYMNIEQFGTTSAIVEYSKILQNAQGKGLGNLLYSEAMERLRSIGVKDVSGMIIDENDRPIKIRKKVIDEQNKAIGNRYDYTTIDDVRTDEKGSSQKDITSYLDPRARYMPSEQAQAWRDFKAEPTTEGNSIFKNAMNFVIIQANNKYKVYNPQKALLGIYTDLDGAKRRVQREEPKQQ